MLLVPIRQTGIATLARVAEMIVNKEQDIRKKIPHKGFVLLYSLKPGV